MTGSECPLESSREWRLVVLKLEHGSFLCSDTPIKAIQHSKGFFFYLTVRILQMVNMLLNI